MKTSLCCYTFVKPDREYSQGLKTSVIGKLSIRDLTREWKDCKHQGYHTQSAVASKINHCSGH